MNVAVELDTPQQLERRSDGGLSQSAPGRERAQGTLGRAAQALTELGGDEGVVAIGRRATRVPGRTLTGEILGDEGRSAGRRPMRRAVRRQRCPQARHVEIRDGTGLGNVGDELPPGVAELRVNGPHDRDPELDKRRLGSGATPFRSRATVEAARGAGHQPRELRVGYRRWRAHARAALAYWPNRCSHVVHAGGV